MTPFFINEKSESLKNITKEENKTKRKMKRIREETKNLEL